LFKSKICVFLGKPIPIGPTVDRLFPTVRMANLSVEANFGDDLAKPFKYKIDCSGLVLEFERIRWEGINYDDDEHEKPIECLVCLDTFPVYRMFFCNAPTAQHSCFPHSFLNEETNKPGPSCRLLYRENQADQG
jgi:hypothetical protein